MSGTGGLRSTAVAAICAVLLAACGGGSSGGAPTAASASAGALATPPAQPVEIRLGYGTAAEENVWLMLAKPDLAPNQGKWYSLKATQFRASDERLSAFEAGQLDAGTMPAATALFAADRGVPLKLVASIVRESIDPKWFRTTFIALADSGIKSPKDLKGKTIGLPGFKTATEAWSRATLTAAGLDPNKDVKFVVIGFPAMGEALRTKKVDAGAFPQPFYAIEKAKGGIVDVYDSRTGSPFEEDNLTLAFTPDFVAKNPGVMRAFLADFVATTKWYLANQKDGRQALIDKKFVATTPDIYLGLVDYFREPTGKISTDGLQKHHDQLLANGWIAKKVDLTKLVDLSLLP
ncbi:MAG TPA: ABC transporter substrate-binding protein [Candidatus Limnocylindria bacterium]|nr:ABC transporter substrate-binding protein [Candidatus Limnocylindria bacterium]